MKSSVSWQKVLSLSNPCCSVKGQGLSEKNNGLNTMGESDFQEIFEKTSSFDEKKAELLYVPDSKANLKKVVEPDMDESMFPSFLFDPIDRGLEKMVLVVFDKDGKTIGAVGESGIASFTGRSSALYSLSELYNSVGRDVNRFADALEEMGLTVKTYQDGDGPTYSEVFEDMYEMKYMDMVEMNSHGQ